MEERLRALGIGSLRYDYYGHGPRYVGGARYGIRPDVTLSKTVASLEAVIGYARDFGDLRLGLFGSSFGGLVSLVAAAKDGNIKALALRSPVTEPISFWRGRAGDAGISKWLEEGLLSWEQAGESYSLLLEFWKDLQQYRTLDLASLIKCPAYIIHGDADEVVPLAQSESLASVLGIKVEVLSGANHHYSEPQQLEYMKQRVVSFFAETL